MTCDVSVTAAIVCILTIGEDDRRFIVFNVLPKNFSTFEDKEQVG
jgi:hypothetical protein